MKRNRILKKEDVKRFFEGKNKNNTTMKTNELIAIKEEAKWNLQQIRQLMEEMYILTEKANQLLRETEELSGKILKETWKN